MTGFNISLEPSSSATIAREYSNAVAVLVCVYELDGIVEGGDIDADEDGAEDFFGVAAHVGFDVCDYCGTDLWCVKMLDSSCFRMGPWKE